MAKFVGELLLFVLRAIVMEMAYSLWVKFATWLDPRVRGKVARIVVAILLGLTLFFMFPILAGLLS